MHLFVSFRSDKAAGQVRCRVRCARSLPLDSHHKEVFTAKDISAPKICLESSSLRLQYQGCFLDGRRSMRNTNTAWDAVSVTYIGNRCVVSDFWVLGSCLPSEFPYHLFIASACPPLPRIPASSSVPPYCNVSAREWRRNVEGTFGV